MRNAAVIFLLFLLSGSATAQTDVQHFNDSCFRYLHDWFRVCKTLKSTKRASRAMIREDRKLISLINRIYSNTNLTLESLRKEAAHFPNKSFDSSFKNGARKVEFTPYTEGQLRVYIVVELADDVVRHLDVQIDTKGRTLCDDDWFTPGFFDFIYFERFLPEVRFPAKLRTYQTSIRFER